MNPAAILSEICIGRPRRNDAARALDDLVHRLAAGALLEPTTKQIYQIPERDRDDIRATVIFTVIRKSPLLNVIGKSDGECVRYLQTMLVRAWLTHRRKSARLEPHDDQALERLEHDKAPSHQVERESHSQDVAKGREVLDRVLAHALDGIDAKHRANYERAWLQLVELVFGDGDLRAMIARDEGIAETADEAEFTKARNRVFQIHRRLRVRLAESVQTLGSTGALSPEETAMATRIVDQVLVRCQRSKASGV